MDEGLYLLGVGLPIPRLRGSPLSEEEEGAKEKRSLHSGKRNLQSLGQSDDPGRCHRQFLGDGTLDKLAFLLYSKNNKLDKKVRRHNSKVRRHIATKGQVRGKNLYDKRKAFWGSQIKLKAWPPWQQVCHTCLKPFCPSYLTQIKLREIF